MEINFLGVGEACDGRQPNTAMILKTAPEQHAGRILLDCGFTVPHRYIALAPDPEELETLWLSHYHGDHFFGTPLLLLWLHERGRLKPLQIMGPPGVDTKITQAMELAYPTLLPRLKFPLEFLTVEQGRRKKTADITWQGAFTEHSQPCLSLRVELQNRIIFYSGDGRPTPATQVLAEGCDIIIHEAYGLAETTPGHGSVGACLEFARLAGSKRIALVHIQRDIRKRLGEMLPDMQRHYPEMTILLPEKGTRISL